MTPEVWQRARTLFHGCIDLDGASRCALLDRECTGDPDLRSEVLSLLEMADSSSSFMEEPASGRYLADQHQKWIGLRVGSYQITALIGVGGMGVVYRAERADDLYRKEVAIKLLRSGLGSDSMLARFKAERQILASLEHPNIARLLDGGVAGDGSPYLVMELVDGLPIDEYCDLRKLTTIERLKLFRCVCSAVHYAHEHSVIHRDLKPRNILVNRDGVPKLLDFGIAKILDPASIRAATVEPTLTMMRALTPEYASPEQMRGESIGPASDVYSLGVILYVALTGHRPYNWKNDSPHEVSQAVCEVEPEKPSAVLSRTDDAGVEGKTLAPDVVSSTRGEALGRLRRRLTGDIDNIVLKALRKEPWRRYASAHELSEDIRRHLEGSPVRARKDTVAYRLGKFIGRNAPMVGAAFILLVAASIGIDSFVARRHEAGRIAAAKPSPINVRPSIAVLGFKNLSGREQSAWLSTALSEMLNTELAAGEKLRTVSGESVARMKTDLALADSESYAPDTLRKIRGNLGADYVIVGSYLQAEAGAAVRVDMRLQDAAGGGMLASVSESGTEANLSDIATRAAKSLRATLKLPDTSDEDASAARAAIPSDPAARLYAQGLARLRSFDALGARGALEQAVAADSKFALAHSALAAAWAQLGYDAKAADESKRALELSVGLSREDRLGIEARYDEATHDWPKAVQIYSSLYNFFPDNLEYGLRLADVQNRAGRGDDAVVTVQALRNLPAPARDDPAIDLAEALSAQSVSDYERERRAAANAIRKANGAGMRSLAARALLAQSFSLGSLAQPDGAIAAATSAKRMYDQLHDPGGAAHAANSLGNALYESGDLAAARQAFEEALKTYRDIGNLHGTAAALANVANVVGDLGDLNAALRISRQALDIYRQIADKLGVGDSLNDIGADLIFLGDLAGATQAFEQSLAIKREIGDHNGIAQVLNNIGDVLITRGEIHQAQRSFEEAITIHRSMGHIRSLAMPLEGLAETAAAGGDLSSGKQDLAEVLAITHQSGDKHLAALAISMMGDIQLQEGDLAAARKSYLEALELRIALGEKGNAEETELAVAELALEEGDFGEAHTRGEKALGEFTAESLKDDQILAHVLLARTLLAESKAPDAQHEIELAERTAAHSQNLPAALKLAMVSARADLVSRKAERSINTLSTALADAKQHGLVSLQFQVSLVLGEIELKSGRVSAGRKRLDSLEKQAAAKGFGLIARNAAALTRSAAL